jgi:hypothetical protein
LIPSGVATHAAAISPAKIIMSESAKPLLPDNAGKTAPRKRVTVLHISLFRRRSTRLWHCRVRIGDDLSRFSTHTENKAAAVEYALAAYPELTRRIRKTGSLKIPPPHTHSTPPAVPLSLY